MTPSLPVFHVIPAEFQLPQAAMVTVLLHAFRGLLINPLTSQAVFGILLSLICVKAQPTKSPAPCSMSQLGCSVLILTWSLVIFSHRRCAIAVRYLSYSFDASSFFISLGVGDQSERYNVVAYRQHSGLIGKILRKYCRS